MSQHRFLPANFSSVFWLPQEFNAGFFDYLIATDDNKIKEEQNAKVDNAQSKKSKQPKNKADTEFGVVRGVDFKNVYTVSYD